MPHRTLTPAQRRLLPLFDRPVPEEDWDRIRDLLADYFAAQAVDAFDATWDEQGWTDETVEQMLHAHERRQT